MFTDLVSLRDEICNRFGFGPWKECLVMDEDQLLDFISELENA